LCPISIALISIALDLHHSHSNHAVSIISGSMAGKSQDDSASEQALSGSDHDDPETHSMVDGDIELDDPLSITSLSSKTCLNLHIFILKLAGRTQKSSTETINKSNAAAKKSTKKVLKNNEDSGNDTSSFLFLWQNLKQSSTSLSWQTQPFLRCSMQFMTLLDAALLQESLS